MIVSFSSAAFHGLPGTQMTTSGYDNEFSFDAICWLSRSQYAPNLNDVAVEGRNNLVDRPEDDGEKDYLRKFPNALVANFSLNGQVELLQECPPRISVTVSPPKEFEENGFRPRTHQWYNYTVRATVDLGNVMGDHIVSDHSRPRVAIQVLLCYIKVSGFCSPFVHEQAIARVGNTTTRVGDRHGGSHVHAPFQFIDLDPTQQYHELDVTVPTIVNDHGDYFGIGSIQFFTGNGTNLASYRYDVANALQHRVVQYQDPMVVLTVRPTVECMVAVACAVIGGILCYFLYQTVLHRKNQIMQLSQGNFLILSLVAAIWVVASISLLNPKSDLYCNLYSPLILIPTQLIYAITIGRLWRIEKVISPLLKSDRSKSGIMGGIIRCFTKCTNCFGLIEQKQNNGIRHSVTSWQLASVVALFTFPQIVLQVLAFLLQRKYTVIHSNEDESVGRMECYTDGAHSITNYCFFLLMGLNAILLVFAQACKNLPSLFNETEIIHSSTLVNATVLVLGYGVVVVSRGPTTSPDVDFILWAAIILTICLNSTVRIVLPKLRMIWRGETILVSQLVTDHRASLRASTRSNAVLKNVTGFTPSESFLLANDDSLGELHDFTFNSRETSATTNHSSFNSSGLAPVRRLSSLQQNIVLEGHMEEDEETSINEDPLMPKKDQQRKLQQDGSSHKSSDTVETVDSDEKRRELALEQSRQKPTTVLIEDGQAPDRSLVIPMLELQRRLVAVNQHITRGTSVSHRDWEKLRSLNAALAATFSRRVEFGWEIEGSFKDEPSAARVATRADRGNRDSLVSGLDSEVDDIRGSHGETELAVKLARADLGRFSEISGIGSV